MRNAGRSGETGLGPVSAERIIGHTRVTVEGRVEQLRDRQACRLLQQQLDVCVVYGTGPAPART